jgi:hypothetical protein
MGSYAASDRPQTGDGRVLYLRRKGPRSDFNDFFRANAPGAHFHARRRSVPEDLDLVDIREKAAV